MNLSEFARRCVKLGRKLVVSVDPPSDDFNSVIRIYDERICFPDKLVCCIVDHIQLNDAVLFVGTSQLADAGLKIIFEDRRKS